VGLSQLLQNATAFLDVRKQLVTTVPGLVLAAALSLLTGTAPAWVARPFVCASTASLMRESVARAEALRIWDTTRTISGLTNEDLIQRRAAEATYRRQLQRAAIAVQNCKPETCSQALTALQNATDAVKKFVAGSGNYRAIQPDADAAALQARSDQDALFEAHRKLAWLEADPTCAAPLADWPTIAADVLMFGVLGLMLGLMLDPVNKALFLQVLPEAAGSSSTGRRYRVRKYFARTFVSRASRTYPRSDVLSRHRVQFYIGRGVITEAEYQALIDKYYRFAELTIGLVIPLLITTAGLFQYEWLRDRPGRAVASLMLIPLAIALARVGVRRHSEFKDATRDLILGRLERLELEEKARATTVNLLQLQQLVSRAKELMERHSA